MERYKNKKQKNKIKNIYPLCDIWFLQSPKEKIIKKIFLYFYTMKEK